MNLSNTPTWFYLLLILPLLFRITKIIQNNRSRKNLDPGPTKLPIIGNLHLLGKLPHQTLWQLSKKYGLVMQLQLGSKPILIVSSAEAAKDILKTHDNECCSRPALLATGRLSYNYLDVGFSPNGEYWRQIRRICVLELFSSKRARSFRHIREEVALLIQSISEPSCSASPVVNLSEKGLTLTASIVLRVAFGERFRGSGIDNDRFEELVREAQALLGSFSASDFSPYVGWIVDRPSSLHARLERSFHDWDFFYQKVIDDHLDPERMKQKQEDIVDVILRIERENQSIGTKQFTAHHVEGYPHGKKQTSSDGNDRGGRRGCPGIQMGMTMVELALANLLYSFDWKLPAGMEEEDISMEEEAGLTVSKKSPLELMPIKHE